MNIISNNKPIKILGINGSHNKDGNVAFLINALFKECEKYGWQCEMLSAHDAVASAKTPFCVSCSSPCSKQCYKGTYLEEMFNKMAEADAIIFGSPVYFGSMSGQLKCLFDKTRDIRAKHTLIGKLGVAVSCGASKYGGQETTVSAIHDCMLVDGMTIIGASSYELGAGHQGICAQKPASEDEFALARVKLVAARLYEQLVK